MTNLYRNTARLYDTDNRPGYQDDIPFYIERASRKKDGHVLELACGTGRILIPMVQELAADRGEVWGLDYSRRMLEVCKRKAAALPQQVQSKLHLIEGDMTDFSLTPQKFKLIYIPFRSIQSLSNDDLVRRTLQCVRRHLADDGEFIVNVFRPYAHLDENWVNMTEQLDFESGLDTGEKVTRHSIRRKIDTDRRLIYTDLIYRVYHEDGTVEEVRDNLCLRYYYGDDLRQLIRDAGFTIFEEYGWYDGTPVEDGKEFIFVCKK